MTLLNTVQRTNELRAQILANPKLILDDPDVMRALVRANDNSHGDKVIDLRGAAMDRLETRLGRLEETHQNIIATAFDNLAGTKQINEAVLKIIDPKDFLDFLQTTASEVSEIMRIDFIGLFLETKQPLPDTNLSQLHEILTLVPEGFIDSYIKHPTDLRDDKVTLRQVKHPEPSVYASLRSDITSEACLALNLGDEALFGMLVLGSQDPNKFSPAQGTDLLTFFASVYERALSFWLPQDRL